MRCIWLTAAVAAATTVTPRVNPAVWPVVHVGVENDGRIGVQELRRAEAQAERIYATAKVDIAWDAGDGSDFGIVLLAPDADALAGTGSEAVGFAPSGDQPERCPRAYVFAGKVRTAAALLRIDFADLLGCAIAHELGHLLLPSHPHSHTGIMRAGWDPGHVPAAGSEYLRFTPEEVRLLQRRPEAQ